MSILHLTKTSTHTTDHRGKRWKPFRVPTNAERYEVCAACCKPIRDEGYSDGRNRVHVHCMTTDTD